MRTAVIVRPSNTLAHFSNIIEKYFDQLMPTSEDVLYIVGATKIGSNREFLEVKADIIRNSKNRNMILDPYSSVVSNKADVGKLFELFLASDISFDRIVIYAIMDMEDAYFDKLLEPIKSFISENKDCKITFYCPNMQIRKRIHPRVNIISKEYDLQDLLDN